MKNRSYWFYSQLILSLSTHTICHAHSVMGSYIHWKDHDMITVYGNWYSASGFPKKVTLLAEGVFLLPILKLIVAIKILRNDLLFHFTMEPLAVIIKARDRTENPVGGGGHEGITDQIHSPGTIYMYMVYYTLTGFFGFGVVAFSSFFLYPNVRITIIRIDTFAFKSLIFGFIGSQIVWKTTILVG